MIRVGLVLAAPTRTGVLAVAALVAVGAVVRGRASARRRAALDRLGPGAGRSRIRAVDRFGALVPAPPAAVDRWFRRAGVGSRTGVLLWQVGTVGATATVVLAAAAGGVGAVVLTVVVGVLVVGLVRVGVGDRAATLVDRELPGVLATVAAGVRSGASLAVAVQEGSRRARGPVAEDLAAVVDSLAAGTSLVDAIGAWVRARQTPGVRMAGAALALAAETGGAGARTIDGVAATLHDRLAVDRELAALSSQARASAVVIGVAPIGFVILTALSDPGVWDFFLRTPAGLLCLAAGCLLDGIGAGWMVVVARGAR